MITVFYDGKCSLCSKEINYYRKIAPNYVFEWKDITNSADDLKKHNISASEGLKLLHAIDENGRLHIGVDAFILIWKKLQYWKVLAYMTSLPAIRQIANIIYQVFADWRFKRLKHCQIVAKQE
jgi:predicted DCC family thiol-disulfide oxidoreductase YuxK